MSFSAMDEPIEQILKKDDINVWFRETHQAPAMVEMRILFRLSSIALNPVQAATCDIIAQQMRLALNSLISHSKQFTVLQDHLGLVVQTRSLNISLKAAMHKLLELIFSPKYRHKKVEIDVVREQVRQQYRDFMRNSKLIAFDHASSFLTPAYCLVHKKLAALDQVNKQSLDDLLERLINKSQKQCLIHGVIKKEKALIIAQSTEEQLKSYVATDEPIVKESETDNLDVPLRLLDRDCDLILKEWADCSGDPINYGKWPRDEKEHSTCVDIRTHADPQHVFNMYVLQKPPSLEDQLQTQSLMLLFEAFTQLHLQKYFEGPAHLEEKRIMNEIHPIANQGLLMVNLQEIPLPRLSFKVEFAFYRKNPAFGAYWISVSEHSLLVPLDVIQKLIENFFYSYLPIKLSLLKKEDYTKLQEKLAQDEALLLDSPLHLLEQHWDALSLCWQDSLHLQRSISDYLEQISFTTFRDWCIDLLNRKIRQRTLSIQVPAKFKC